MTVRCGCGGPPAVSMTVTLAMVSTEGGDDCAPPIAPNAANTRIHRDRRFMPKNFMAKNLRCPRAGSSKLVHGARSDQCLDSAFQTQPNTVESCPFLSPESDPRRRPLARRAFLTRMAQLAALPFLTFTGSMQA